MKSPNKFPFPLAWIIAIALAVVVAACNGHSGGLVTPPNTGGTLAPAAISATNPANGSIGAGTNTAITVSFSTLMNAATISAASFTLTGPGNVAVRGTVAYDNVNNFAIFVPASALAAGSSYTGTLTTAVTDQNNNALAANYTWTFTTGAGADTTPPQLIAMRPANLAVGVPVNTAISATFSKAMSVPSLNPLSFTVNSAQGPVAGSITYFGNTVLFTPSASLPANTTVTVTLSSAQDLVGNTLIGIPQVWSFTTGGATDTTVPAVRLAFPPNQTINVPTNQLVAVNFSNAMNPSTVTTASFSLTAPGAIAVAGTVSAAGNYAVFTPSASLLPNTTYVATIASTVKDLAGNAPLASFPWSFTTGTLTNTAPPTIVSTTPATGATTASINQTVSFTFNEPLDPRTTNSLNVTLTNPNGVAVAGTVSYDPALYLLSFTPSANLSPFTTYQAIVSGAVTDLYGNALAGGAVASFTTGSATGGTAPLNLNSLTTFAAVAGNGLANSNIGGQTTINGNVGLSPVGTCTGDGASCLAPNPQINGSLYVNDTGGVAAQAQVDLLAAIKSAALRPPGTAVSDVTGMTLKPGVYTATGNLNIAAGGTLTLDAGGDPTAVWIFQVRSALTVNPNVQVVLINGARPANVFWAVTGSASLGNNVNFQGNLLANGPITVGTGSIVNGRLLSNTGLLTLTATTLTRP